MGVNARPGGAANDQEALPLGMRDGPRNQADLRSVPALPLSGVSLDQTSNLTVDKETDLGDVK